MLPLSEKRAISIMSSIKKRFSEKTQKFSYQATLELGKDANGNRKRDYHTFSSEADAKMFIKEADVQLYYGSFVKKSKATVKDVAEMWLTYIEGKNRKYNTIRGYTTNVNKHILPSIGEIQIQKLQPYHINDMIVQMQKRGLAATTIWYAIRNLKQILDYAVNRQILRKSPFYDIDLPKQVPFKCNPYTTDELRELVQASIGTDLEWVLRIEVETGLRIGELLALKWSDIDFEKNTLTVNGTVVYIPKKGCQIDTPKNVSSNRTIPVSQSLIDNLKWLKKIEKKRLKAFKKKSRIDDKTIIHNKNWMPCIPSSISSRYSEFLKENNLRHIRFHDLRHTHASLLYNEYDLNITAIRDRLGHSRASTTMNFYVSGTSKQQLSGVEKLNIDIYSDDNNIVS